MNRIELLGVQIDNVTYDDVLKRIEEMIHARTPQQIVSPAIDQIIQARRDQEFEQVISESALVVADGISVTAAAWLHKTPLKQRVTGADLVPKVCELAAKKGFSIFFLGGDEGIADQVAVIMQEQYPGLQVAGTYCPPYRFEDNPEIESTVISKIKESKPDVLFTALSSPRQEKWIRRRKEQLGVPVSFGVGGAFNFITGNEKRAPVWMQKLGIEWLFRMCQRPSTIGKRLLRSSPAYFMLLIDRLSYAKQKQVTRLLRPALLVAVDLLLAVFVYMFSYWLYFRQLFPQQDPYPNIESVFNTQAYGDLLFYLPLLCVLAIYYSKLYRKNPYITSYRLTMQSIKAAVFSVLIITAFQFMFKNLFADISGFSRGVFGIFGVLFGMSILCWRMLFQQAERWFHRNGINLDRIVMVGHDEISQEIIKTINDHPAWGIYLVGYVTTTQESSTTVAIPYLGTLDDLERILPARKIDEVIIAQSSIPLQDIERIHTYCKTYNIKAGIVPSSYLLLNDKSNIKQFGDCRVISL